jgi:UDP-2,3-diacylglucosamine pyrophosphatase LpxH
MVLAAVAYQRHPPHPDRGEARHGVTYIIGNHDEFLRAFLQFRLAFGDIRVKNRALHDGEDGKRYLVVHGDMFDGMMRADRKWIMHLGDHAYNFLLWTNTKLNRPSGAASACLTGRSRRP